VATPGLKLLLAGDLMLGRGMDQVLPQHCTPELVEPCVHDARTYVRLAEARHGPIPAPVPHVYPWGMALALMRELAPDLFLVNLETAITTADHPWPGKAVHYRLHPGNVACLTAAGIHGCCLANNHVLDWGFNGLAETLRCLQQVGIASTGAGLSLHQAQGPLALPLAGGGRLLVFARALASSGVPDAWQAQLHRPGVALLPQLNAGTARALARSVCKHRRPGDRVLLSLHWGANWVEQIPELHRWFAHQMIDLAGVDVVFGHSSHHPLPLEVYGGKLILYGCGDLLNDYEGIGAERRWRSDCPCLYSLELDRLNGELECLEIVPLRLRRFQLQWPEPADRLWLQGQLGLEAAAAGRFGGWRLQRDRLP